MKTGLYTKGGVLVKELTNLGWLVSNKYEVKYIDLLPGDHENVSWCILAAYMADGQVFKCYFASREVCRKFIAARRCWKGL